MSILLDPPAKSAVPPAQSVRSSPIFYPGWDDLPGLNPMDLTGDGEQLVMRIADPAGGANPLRILRCVAKNS